ncbi:MAG: DUF3786 domain-containing protein [Desulfobacterales bacterium]|jgi:hypothetical protein|nr:DUF3786 domain-containing protein [Desulfobacteraceae bacterium]MBT7085363.1 DUF3786 domain-containing protein [Desulfobacterales bacterium]MBT7696677.1 DUF3786 domain-containing protein [Desulfobacterales bacterium]
MTNPVDMKYFQELSEKKPKDVCRRTICKYDDEKKFYTVSVWGDEYAVYPHKFKITRITSNFENPHEFIYLFIIYYLLNSKEIGISSEWISEKDIPGGVTFFRGPHEIPTHLISKQYGNNINNFRKRCEQLHGIPLDMADAAYSFKITSNISVAVLYWAGDDDFPPESKILYDKTISEHLALDILFALAITICTRIGTPD